MNRNNEISEAPVYHDGNGADVILHSTNNFDIRTSTALSSRTSDFFQTTFMMQAVTRRVVKMGLAVEIAVVLLPND